MKKQLAIPLLIVLYLLCSSRSCDDQGPSGSRQDAKLAAARDSIREVFESDFLSPDQLHGFEVTAMQKARDVADYYTILCDTAANILFREKAAGLLNSLFINDDVLLDIINSANIKTLRQLTREGLSGQGPTTALSVKDVSLARPLSRLNDTLYNGKLQVQYLIGRTASSSQRSKTMDFQVARINKVFGKDSLRVWTVQLGSMN